jgi:RNA polymerase-binding transcription factor DksA
MSPDQRTGDAARRRAVEEERATTTSRLEALETERRAIVAGTVDANSDDEHDPEGSTIAYERARVEALADAARRSLAELDRALAKLEDGTGSVCDRCGDTIDPERLVVRPASTTCLRCAATRPRG